MKSKIEVKTEIVSRLMRKDLERVPLVDENKMKSEIFFGENDSNGDWPLSPLNMNLSINR